MSPTVAQSPSPEPTPSPTPTPLAVRAGAPAYAAVAVATLWRSPSSPRAVDAPALANPVRIAQWLAALTASDQAGLIDRADSQVLLGERVDVLAITAGWAQVVVPDQPTRLDARGYPGWIPVAQLSGAAPVTAAWTATVTQPLASLTRDRAAVMEVSFGTRVPQVGWGDGTVKVGLPGGGVLEVALNAVALSHSDQPALQPSAASVMAAARTFLGLRYLWAGTSGFGFDCSGLVHLLLRVHGVTVPRDADDQAKVGAAVSRAQLQPGDLVFLAAGGTVHHVALYAGNNSVLDAPDLGKPVQVVSLASEPYASEYAGARRVIT
ncbi:MAG TPA: C40 family peptidase [Patescibacteria group bacterium]|nr:C40 family peptidase [Patescibacteria group bacterium]